MTEMKDYVIRINKPDTFRIDVNTKSVSGVPFTLRLSPRVGFQLDVEMSPIAARDVKKELGDKVTFFEEVEP